MEGRKFRKIILARVNEEIKCFSERAIKRFTFFIIVVYILTWSFRILLSINNNVLLDTNLYIYIFLPSLYLVAVYTILGTKATIIVIINQFKILIAWRRWVLFFVACFMFLCYLRNILIISLCFEEELCRMCQMNYFQYDKFYWYR